MKRVFQIFVLLILIVNVHAQINVPYWLDYGRQKITENDNLGAIEAFNIIITHHPDVEDAFFFRALAKYNLADYRGAISDYSSAIELNPIYSEHFLYRGQAKEQIYDYAGAHNDYNKAIELKPFSVDAYLCRGINSIITKKYSDALSDFDNALYYDKKNAYAWLYKAIAKQYNEKNEDAIADFNKSIQLNPNNADAFIRRGKNFAELKRYKEAIADFNQALILAPTSSFAYYNRALARCEMEENNGAMNDFNRVIALDPENDITYYNRAELKSKIGDPNGAIDDYNQVITLNPTNIYTYFNRGITYQQLKNFKKAIDDYSKAIELNPDFAVAYYNRAIAKKQINDAKGAFRDYEMASKLDANADSLKKAGRLDSSGLARIVQFRADFSEGNVTIAGNTDKGIGLFPNFNYYLSSDTTLKQISNAYNYVYINSVPTSSKDKVVLSCLDYPLNNDSAKLKIQNLQTVSEKSDSVEYIQFAKTVLLLHLQLFDMAIEENTNLILQQKMLPQAYLNRGNIYFEKMQYLSNVEEIYPNINFLGENKTTASSSNKPIADFSQAIADYKICVQLDPKNKYAWVNLGNAQNESGEFQQAVNAYTKAILIDPKFGIAYYNRGLTYLRSVDKSVGCADLSKAGELGILKAYEAIKKMCN